MSKRVALVTNALEFAGQPAVMALRESGFQVIAHDIAFADAEKRDGYQRTNPDVVALVAQLPEEIVESAWVVERRLDVLVSNDAYPPIHGPIANANVDDLRATLDHLVLFPFALAKTAIPRLIAQQSARVVFITSNRTRLPLPGGAIPDAARAALNALVKSLSLELAPHGIPVNAIAPNYLIAKPIFRKLSLSMTQLAALTFKNLFR